MFITNKTVISFKFPEESDAAGKFAAEHPDWKILNNSNFVSYTNTTTYSIEPTTKE